MNSFKKISYFRKTAEYCRNSMISLLKPCLLSAISLAFLAGCSCKESYMPPISIISPNDTKLNCTGLAVAVTEMKALMQNVNVRCKRPHLFSPYPNCIPWVKQDAARNYHIISDRIAYLKLLHSMQKCNPVDIADDGDLSYASAEKCCESIGLENGARVGEIQPKNDKLQSYTIPSN